MSHRGRKPAQLDQVRDPGHIEDLRNLLGQGMSGEFGHWELSGDGRWPRRTTDAEGEPLPDLQSTLIEMHAKRRRKARRR